MVHAEHNMAMPPQSEHWSPAWDVYVVMLHVSALPLFPGIIGDLMRNLEIYQKQYWFVVHLPPLLTDVLHVYAFIIFSMCTLCNVINNVPVAKLK